MELPKNIVQIGKPDKVHKIFVEDYVVSYIKQLNKKCDGRAVGLALYGKFYEEDGCKYYFLYGATQIEGLEHRGPYLSQNEKEEIESIGQKYFDGYEFLAWCNVKGEPVDCFYVLVQQKGVAVEGYACFYEKNESMLNYMLFIGEKEKEPEPEKTEEKKPARGEWVAIDYVKAAEKNAMKSPVPKPKNAMKKKTEYMKMAAAAVFLVLCVVGITTFNDYEKMEELQVAARQVIASMSEQKLPDKPPAGAVDVTPSPPISAVQESASVTPAEGATVTSPLPDDLAGNGVQNTMPPVESVAVTPPNTMPPVESAAVTPPNGTQPDESVAVTPQTPETEAVSQENAVTEPVLTSYTIVKGDTLISICLIRYGSLDRMQEICERNGITNADSIQIGQTILLP